MHCGLRIADDEAFALQLTHDFSNDIYCFENRRWATKLVDSDSLDVYEHIERHHCDRSQLISHFY